MIEQQQVGEFLDTLASRASTPGGGAVAGLAGAEAAALVAMVCHLTRNKEDTIAPVLRVAEAARRAFLQLADDDARTFAAVMTAWRLPTESRASHLQPALRAAAEVPLGMMTLTATLVEPLEVLFLHGNPRLITDVGIAALMLVAAHQSAQMNVLINLREITDEAFASMTRSRLRTLEDVVPRLQQLGGAIDRNLRQ